MMKEVHQVKQNPGEPTRRWFYDDYFDLIVWLTPDGKAYGFQLCYDKKGNERSLTWKSSGHFSHDRIDDGEGRAFRHKSAPIAMKDGLFDATGIGNRFLKASEQLPEDLRSVVLQAIRKYQG